MRSDPGNELSEGAGARMDAATQGPVVNAKLETTAEGIFACGNVLHVHDLVDNVSKEAHLAGAYAAEYIKEGFEGWGEPVRPKIPEKSKCVLPEGRDSSRQLICIGCPVGCLITAENSRTEPLRSPATGVPREKPMPAAR